MFKKEPEFLWGSKRLEMEVSHLLSASSKHRASSFKGLRHSLYLVSVDLNILLTKIFWKYFFQTISFRIFWWLVTGINILDGEFLPMQEPPEGLSLSTQKPNRLVPTQSNEWEQVEVLEVSIAPEILSSPCLLNHLWAGKMFLRKTGAPAIHVATLASTPSPAWPLHK